MVLVVAKSHSKAKSQDEANHNVAWEVALKVYEVNVLSRGRFIGLRAWHAKIISVEQDFSYWFLYRNLSHPSEYVTHVYDKSTPWQALRSLQQAMNLTQASELLRLILIISTKYFVLSP